MNCPVIQTRRHVVSSRLEDRTFAYGSHPAVERWLRSDCVWHLARSWGAEPLCRQHWAETTQPKMGDGRAGSGRDRRDRRSTFPWSATSEAWCRSCRSTPGDPRRLPRPGSVDQEDAEELAQLRRTRRPAGRLCTRPASSSRPPRPSERRHHECATRCDGHFPVDLLAGEASRCDLEQNFGHLGTGLPYASAHHRRGPQASVMLLNQRFRVSVPPSPYSKRRQGELRWSAWSVSITSGASTSASNKAHLRPAVAAAGRALEQGRALRQDRRGLGCMASTSRKRTRWGGHRAGVRQRKTPSSTSASTRRRTRRRCRNTTNQDLVCRRNPVGKVEHA